MTLQVKKIAILVLVLILSLPLLYAQEAEQITEKPIEEQSTPAPLPEQAPNPFLEFVNTEAYADTIDEDEERKILREKWKEFLHIDMFYPYFKAKEVERWVRDKASVKVFKIRGRPKFENNQIKYTFKLKF